MSHVCRCWNKTNRHDVVAFSQGVVLSLHPLSLSGAIMRMHSYENPHEMMNHVLLEPSIGWSLKQSETPSRSNLPYSWLHGFHGSQMLATLPRLIKATRPMADEHPKSQHLFANSHAARGSAARWWMVAGRLCATDFPNKERQTNILHCCFV